MNVNLRSTGLNVFLTVNIVFTQTPSEQARPVIMRGSFDSQGKLVVSIPPSWQTLESWSYPIDFP